LVVFPLGTQHELPHHQCRTREATDCSPLTSPNSRFRILEPRSRPFRPPTRPQGRKGHLQPDHRARRPPDR
jgi:hypothetical protein